MQIEKLKPSGRPKKEICNGLKCCRKSHQACEDCPYVLEGFCREQLMTDALALLEDRNCDTCRHYLGGGCCRINLEAECAAGEHEAWEPKEDGSHD